MKEEEEEEEDLHFCEIFLSRTQMKRPFGRMLRDTMMIHAVSLVRTYDDTVRVVGAAAKYT